MTHIEKFLSKNSGEIPPADRAALREVAAKVILGESDELNLSRCQAHLRDEFRRLVVEAAYQHRTKGCLFNPDAEYMPTAGVARYSQIKPVRL